MGHGNSDRLYITHASTLPPFHSIPHPPPPLPHLIDPATNPPSFLFAPKQTKKKLQKKKQREHAGEFGAHSSSVGAQKKDRLLAKLPFDCCALTLKPVTHPVCTDQGTVYDLWSIIPFLRQHGTDPKTGAKLGPGDLTKLTLHRNAQGTYHDPVTFKPFNEHTHIVAIKTSGNVYAYETVHRLNLKPGSFHDLLTDDKFEKKDLITLQDPLNVEAKDLTKFDYVKRELTFGEGEQLEGINTKAVGAGVERVLNSLTKREKVAETAGEKVKGNELAHESNVQVGKTIKPASVTPYNASVTSAGRAAASLTSTSAPVHTAIENALWNEEDLMFEAIKKSGSKAYARLITNFGNLNLELYSHIAPKAAYNFLQLSSQGKYNNTSFHRLIPGFMLQGGDPTGTGRGGSSCWGKPFEDEFLNRNAKKHEERGTLSMANSGPDTNGSQFFLTFRATAHLDGKHTVFGRLVGGEDVLKKIESVPCDVTDRPLKPVTIKEVAIFEDPFRSYREKLEKRLAREQETREGEGLRLKKKEEREKDRTTWFGTDLTKTQQVQSTVHLEVPKVGVGKYIGVPTQENREDNKKRTSTLELDTPIRTTNVSKKRKGGFGDFSSW